MQNILFISNGSPERVDYLAPDEGRYFLLPEIYRSADTGNRKDLLFGPLGYFDLASFLEKTINISFDIVIYHADPAWGFIPTGLNKVAETSVIILGDMHHLKRPIASMLEYVLMENPRVLMPAFTRQHAHWFYAAGFNNFVWEPSFFVTPKQQVLKPMAERTGAGVFCGSSAKTGSHARRARILDWLISHEPSVATYSDTRAKLSSIVNNSMFSINICMNGDFNMRCFESVADGGLLVVDKISPYSGFGDCFSAGENCLVFESPSELLEIAQSKFLLSQVAGKIIEASWNMYWTHYAPKVTWARLLDTLENRRFADLHKWDDRMASSRARASWLSFRISVYEFIQELHIAYDAIYVDISTSAKSVIDNDLADLVRVRPYALQSSAAEHEAVVFIGRPDEESGSFYTHKMHLV